jgi:hypothetical protein
MVVEGITAWDRWIQRGDWRCVYPDGERTTWVSYGAAINLRNIFGGRVEWREDDSVVNLTAEKELISLRKAQSKQIEETWKQIQDAINASE